ncbi:MAG: LPXTG cell wall anchor domain-containing protein [Gemmiger sp.]|nr:LPXTG cell wall anchor domain-containing protein [Gemmiger sp.]
MRYPLRNTSTAIAKTVASLVLAAGLCLAMAPAAQAASTAVTYLGDANRFVEPEGQDLFNNFKGVMPGDTITQIIHLHNIENEGQQVSLYLRAEAPDAAGREFLAQLGMTVRQGDTVLFQGDAAQTGGLSTDVLLGTFTASTTRDLAVTLSVPTTLGNAYQNAAGAVNWVFTAQNCPAPTPSPGTTTTPTGTTVTTTHRAPVPQTGDAAPAPWLLATGMGAALAGLVLLRRRRKL